MKIEKDKIYYDRIYINKMGIRVIEIREDRVSYFSFPLYLKDSILAKYEDGKLDNSLIRDIHIDFFEELFSEKESIEVRYSTSFFTIMKIIDVAFQQWIDTTENNFFDFDIETKTFSYIPIDKIKYCENENCYDASFRKKYAKNIKIGKFLKTHFKRFTDSSIEKYNNVIMAELSLNENIKIEIISGEKIRKYYLEENYDSAYSQTCKELFQSCMRYRNCQQFFDVYVDNAEMIILLSNGSEKIIGRAILWTLIDGTKVCDRIYSSNIGKDVIKKFLKENNIIFKDELSRIDEDSIFIKIKEYRYLPYMDTFCVECQIGEETYLTTGFNSRNSKIDQIIRQDLQETDGNEKKICSICGGLDYSNNGFYLRNGDYIGSCCEDDYIWVESEEDYFHKDNVFYCQQCGDYELIEDRISGICKSCYENNLITLTDTEEEICTLLDEDYYMSNNLYYRVDPKGENNES